MHKAVDALLPSSCLRPLVTFSLVCQWLNYKPIKRRKP